MGEVRFKTQKELSAERLEDWRDSAKVSAFQAYQALDDKGYMDAVESIISDPGTPSKTVRAWNTAAEFRRKSPTVLSLADTLGLTDDQVDDLFEYAATIEA